MTVPQDGPIEVIVEDYLEDLIPNYLQNRKGDAETIAAALDSGDMETARSVGHQMKGSGGGYGFDELTDIGMVIEFGARDGDSDAVKGGLERLLDYLDRVVVSYG